MKTQERKYAKGVGERDGTKTGDEEGVPEVPRKATTVCCPRAMGRESFRRAVSNKETLWHSSFVVYISMEG